MVKQHDGTSENNQLYVVIVVNWRKQTGSVYEIMYISACNININICSIEINEMAKN